METVHWDVRVLVGGDLRSLSMNNGEGEGVTDTYECVRYLGLVLVNN